MSLVADVFSREKRSEIMSRVRARDNRATEVAMVAVLRHYRITGWRRHPQLFGKPDFVFARERVAVFVDGCFWHGCPKHYRFPTTNRAFWKQKLARNRDRDRLVGRTLRRKGWKVLRIWQHEFNRSSERELLRRIRRVLDKP